MPLRTTVVPKVLITVVHRLKDQFIVTNMICSKLVEKLIKESMATNSLRYGIFALNTAE